MVYFCICECYDDYSKCCNYKCRNKFNCHNFDDLKWTINVCDYLMKDINECECKSWIGCLILCPFALTFDIISCPCRCCFSFCNQCDCEKIVTQNQELKKKNKNVSIIITDQPPLYNEHYKHTNVVYPIISLPPIYTE